MSIAVEGAAQGQTILWGAPTYDEVRIGWDEAIRATGHIAHFTQQRMTAEFPSGGLIIYRSLDNPDNARGHTAHGAVIDEVSYVKAAAWYEVIRPMLIDTRGWAWLIGTPNGRNWFWTEHKDTEHEDSISWQVPTLGCEIVEGELIRKPHPLENPSIPWSEIQQLYNQMPKRPFRQEILAEFIEDGGGVFRGVRLAATAQPQKYTPHHTYIMGVDWGKYKDFTVLTVIDANTRKMVAMDRFNQIDYTLQVGRLKALAERYSPVVIMAERNSMGDPLVERLQQDGLPVLPFITTNPSKKTAIEALSLAIERGRLELLDDKKLRDELEAFETERLPSGMLRYTAPEGMTDDIVMSLAMAWHGVTAPKRGTRSRRAA